MKQKISVDDFLFIKLAEAFMDLLDGNSKWYDIQDNTGLSEERCKETEALYVSFKEVYK